MYLITFSVTLLKIRESGSTGMSEAKSWLWWKEELGMEEGHLLLSKQAAE